MTKRVSVMSVWDLYRKRGSCRYRMSRFYGVTFLTFVLLAFPGIAAAVDLLVSTLDDIANDPAIRGGSIVYSITVENFDNDAATSTELVFPMPADSVFDAGASDGRCGFQANYDHDGGALPDFDAVVCSLGTVAGGGSDAADITIVYTGAADTIYVRAWVTSTEEVYVPNDTSMAKDDSSNNNETNNTTILDGADLAIEDPIGTSLVSATPNPVLGGGDVNYTVRVRNKGPDDTTGVQVSIVLSSVMNYSTLSDPNGWTCVHAGADGDGRGGTLTCSLSGSLSSNADSSAFGFTGQVTGASGGNFLTDFTVSSSVADPNGNNDTTSVRIDVNPGTDVAVSADRATYTVTAGGTATVILTPVNNGPALAANTEVTAELPEGFTNVSAADDNGGNNWNCTVIGVTVSCTRTDGNPYAINASDIITLTGDAPSDLAVGLTDADCSDTGGGIYQCTGLQTVISTSTPEAVERLVNNTDTYAITIEPSGVDLEVLSKDMTPDYPVTLGTLLTSTIQVRNNGPLSAPINTVSVIDTLDVDEIYDDTATDAANAGNAWDCFSLGGAPEDIKCIYGAALANNATAPNLIIKANAQIDSGGDSAIITNNACAVYDNTVQMDGGDYIGTNNCDSDGVIVTNGGTNSPDLQVTIPTVNAGGDGNSVLVPGEDGITYTIVVENLDNSIDATGAELDFDVSSIFYDNNPGSAGTSVITVQGTTLSTNWQAIGIVGDVPWNCRRNLSMVECNQTGGSFANGTPASFQVVVSRPLKSGTNLPAIATVGNSVQGDTNRSNNEASIPVDIETEADVQVTKTVLPVSVEAGVRALFTVEVRNNGPSAASDVVLTDTLSIPDGDTGFTLVSITTTGGCTLGGGLTAGASYADTAIDTNPTTVTGTCTWANIPAGDNYSVQYEVRPNWQSGDPNRALLNDALVTTATWESDDANGDGNGEIAAGGGLAAVAATNNRAEATLDIVSSELDLNVENNDSPDPLPFDAASGGDNADNDVVYTIDVRNVSGPSLATGVTFQHTMTPVAGQRVAFLCDYGQGDPDCAESEGICTLAGRQTVTGGASLTTTCALADDPDHNGQLNTGDSYRRFLKYRFLDGPTAGSTDTHQTNAIVSSNEVESNDSNNQESESTNVRAKVDLAVTKDARISGASVSIVQIYQPFDWVMTVTNNGPVDSDPDHTELTDTLPAGFEVTGSVTPDTACGATGSVVTCDFGTIANGDSVEVTVPLRATESGSKTNTAFVPHYDDAHFIDTNRSNNTADDPLTVQSSSISGTVYAENDMDGVLDAGESGIEGVALRLTGTDAYGNPVDRTTTTNASGQFTFDELAPADGGGYTLTETQPAGYQDTQDIVGTDCGTGGGGACGSNVVNDLISGIQLAANSHAIDYLFGEYKSAAIGNYVWTDANWDGRQDAGEPGIPDVTVNLLDAGSNPVTSMQTDTDGIYLFSGLVPGTYTVQVEASTLPAGLSQTMHPVLSGQDFGNQDTPYTVSVGSGEENLTGDFGYGWDPSVAQLGDRVWVDANGNGRQDPGEPGVGGVDLVLTSAGADGVFGTGDDTVEDTTTTNTSGNYIFDNLGPGTYVVTVNVSGSPVSGFSQTGDPDHFGTTGTSDDTTTQPIRLLAGETYLNVDFGYQPATSHSLGDIVWFDANADGAQDGGEPGIAGATLSLRLTGSNAVIATTRTDANGQYLFTGLEAGVEYTVEVTDSDNVLGEMSPTFDWDSGTATPDGRSTVTLASDPDPDLNQDFGYAPAGQGTGDGLIGDTVFLDRNGNGTPDAGEGMEGVEIQLSDSAGIITTAITDENGRYSFSGLPPDTYDIEITGSSLPFGLTNTVDPDGGSAGTSTVILGADVIDLAQDFGYRATVDPGTIGNLLWADLDGDGVNNDGGTPLSGVTLDLYHDRNGNGQLDVGEPRLGTETTDGTAAGNYLFTGLPADAGVDYLVVVADAAGILLGYRHANGALNTDDNSQNTPYAVTLTSGNPSDLTADFGFYLSEARLGDRVWNDMNADGDQDGFEPGVPNVTVTLYDTDDNPVGTTTTNSNGDYSFTGLVEGDYYVVFSNLPPDFVFTDPHLAGGDDALDSDADSSLGRTPSVTLLAGANNTSLDAGIYVPADVVIDLALDKRVNRPSATVLTNVVFTLTLVNDGPLDAVGVVVNDRLPSGYTYLSDDAGGTYDPASGDWSIGNLNAFDQVSLDITARVRTTGLYRNVAEVTGGSGPSGQPDADSTPDNNDGDQSEDDEDAATVTAVSLIDLALEKTVDESAPQIGDEIVFSLMVSNDGPSDATGVHVNELLPSGYTFVSSAGSGSYNPVTGDWDVGDVDAGSVEIIEITVRVKGGGDYDNVAQVTAANQQDVDSTPNNGTGDPVEDDEAALSINTSDEASVELQKTVYEGHGAGSGCASATDSITIVAPDHGARPVTFCYRVTNTGPLHLTNIVFDDLPLNLVGITLTPVTNPDATTLAPGETHVYYYETMLDNSFENEAMVIAEPSDDTGQPLTIDAVSDTDSGVVVTFIFDPPAAYKRVSVSGENILVWEMVWINTGTLPATVRVFDEVPEGTSFRPIDSGTNVSNGVYCEARNASVTTLCSYEPPSAPFSKGRVIWEGSIAGDPGAINEQQAQNEVVIRFETTIDDPEDGRVIENQATSEWDLDNDGSTDIDLNSDDDRTPVIEDPTVYDPTVPWNPAEPGPERPIGTRAIPALQDWAVISMALLLGVWGAWYARRGGWGL